MNPSSQPGALALAMSLAVFLGACGGAAPTSTSAGAASAGKPSAAASAPSSAAASPAASTSVAGSAKPAASSGVALKVGFSQNAVAFTPFFLARDNGMYAKNGLDVSLQMIQGPAAVPALLADEVQLDGLGANELSRASLSGVPLIAIATLGDVPIFNLYADKKYKTVQDLAGQKVGITSPGSSTDVSARLFLEHYGMLGKVEIVPTGGTNVSNFAAVTQGLVAAAIMSPEQASQPGGENLLPLVEGPKLGVPLNFSLIGVKQSFIKDRLDVTKAFLKAHQQAWSYLGDPANKTAVISLLAKDLQESTEVAGTGYDAWFPVWSGQKVPTINPESVTNILRFSDDPKAKAAKGDQFIDNSILQSVQ